MERPCVFCVKPGTHIQLYKQYRLATATIHNTRESLLFALKVNHTLVRSYENSEVSWSSSVRLTFLIGEKNEISIVGNVAVVKLCI